MKGATSTVFLSGDVMTGRGIDQILPHPSAPQIFEGYLKDARGYLELAEQASGAIPKPADFGYPWGDTLSVWEKMAPDLRIINLETSVTTSEDYWKGKGINYRMHPANAPCLTQARIDACSLANNHVLDWGYSGLRETLSTLQGAGVKTAGAGSGGGFGTGTARGPGERCGASLQLRSGDSRFVQFLIMQRF